jgi:hypothetical protein
MLHLRHLLHLDSIIVLNRCLVLLSGASLTKLNLRILLVRSVVVVLYHLLLLCLLLLYHLVKGGCFLSHLLIGTNVFALAIVTILASFIYVLMSWVQLGLLRLRDYMNYVLVCLALVSRLLSLTVVIAQIAHSILSFHLFLSYFS